MAPSAVRPVPYDDARATRLIAAMGDEIAVRYGDGGLSPAAAQEFSLVDHAREAGMVRLLLETGTEQPEAISLYESAGWTPVPAFGHYASDPRTRCYELAL